MQPTTTFAEVLKDPLLKKAVQDLGIHTLTSIQQRTLPFISDGHDVIGQSSTGSGKTLAFALPLLERIIPADGLQILVLVPTRELCEQVAEDFRKAAKYKQLSILHIYGGVSIEQQIRNVPRAHIIVATPGRLRDLLERRAVRLDRIKVVVLDEADRMLDMGFIQDVEFILKTTPGKRQTLMFSATLPREIQHIIQSHMHHPQLVKTQEQVDKTLLKQQYYDVPIRDRFHLLVFLLKKEEAPYAIVFCGTRRTVDVVAYNLNKNGIAAHAIHGGLTQSRRKQVMDSFQGKNTRILVASDVAARGLDIKLLSHVYNFDVPKTAKEYIHRIGRTARAGEEGIAITLVSQKDYENFDRVLSDRSLKIEKMPLPSFPIVQFTPYIQRAAPRQQNTSRFGRGQRFFRRRR